MTIVLALLAGIGLGVVIGQLWVVPLLFRHATNAAQHTAALVTAAIRPPEPPPAPQYAPAAFAEEEQEDIAW
jgi:hypothetical protein